MGIWCESALWRCLSPLIVILALSTYGAADNAPAVLGTNWTSADLDADHKPDLALGRSIAHHVNHLYQVDLTLTSGQRTGSFTFSNPKELELEIVTSVHIVHQSDGRSGHANREGALPRFLTGMDC